MPYFACRWRVLQHSGTKGMHWGVRNYQNPDGTWTELGKERRRIGSQRSAYLRDREKLRTGTLSRTRMTNSAHFRSRLDRNWEEVVNASDLPEPMNVAAMLATGKHDYLKRLEPGMTMSKIHDCNPEYGAPGTTNNCVKCTVALELMYRGYDIRAGRSFNGGSKTAMPYWFDGAVMYREKGAENFISRAEDVLGNNGRAALDFRYPSGSGHAMYAYFDKERNFHIADGQSGEDYSRTHIPKDKQVEDVIRSVSHEYGFDLTQTSAITRLDTCSPNFSHMAEDSVLRMDYTKESMNQIRNKKTGAYGLMIDLRTNTGVPLEYRQNAYDDMQRAGQTNWKDGDYGYYTSKRPFEYGFRYHGVG